MLGLGSSRYGVKDLTEQHRSICSNEQIRVGSMWVLANADVEIGVLAEIVRVVCFFLFLMAVFRNKDRLRE